jgi:hypothetical protein
LVAPAYGALGSRVGRPLGKALRLRIKIRSRRCATNEGLKIERPASVILACRARGQRCGALSSRARVVRPPWASRIKAPGLPHETTERGTTGRDGGCWFCRYAYREPAACPISMVLIVGLPTFAWAAKIQQ